MPADDSAIFDDPPQRVHAVVGPRACTQLRVDVLMPDLPRTLCVLVRGLAGRDCARSISSARGVTAQFLLHACILDIFLSMDVNVFPCRLPI